MTKPIISSFSQITPLLIQQYEHYLPTAFSEELTLLQKVNKIIKNLSDIGEVTNQVITQWNAVMTWVEGEGLTTAVNDQLNTWLESGQLFQHISTINVLIYNADNTKSRGTASDFQNALDFIESMGGGTLYVPDGEYLIDNKLIIPANTTITMDSNARLIRAWAGGFFENGKFDNTFQSMVANGNIIIEGGVLDGNYLGLSQYPADTCDMMLLAYADNITIRNVTFLDVLSYHAIDANGIKNLTIENCTFKGYANVVNTTTPRESIQIGEAQIFDDGRDNYRTCENVLIRGNYFGKSVNCDAPTVAIGNHYSRYSMYNQNIVIENNVIEDCSQFGIRPFKWAKVKIVQNIISRCATGIQLSNASGGIESSKYPNGTQSNLPQSGYDILIQGNSIYDYTNYGIYSSGNYYNGVLAKVKNIKVLDNVISATLSSNQTNMGISFTFAENVDIKGNLFNDTKRGALLMGCKYVNFILNLCTNVYSEALCTLASTITDNTLDGYYTEHLTGMQNVTNGGNKNGMFIQNGKNILIDSNKFIDVARLTDDASRGGVYFTNVINGNIRNNITTGTNITFNVDVDTTSQNITVFNNSGDGPIVLQSSTAKNGYYSRQADGTIVLKELIEP